MIYLSNELLLKHRSSKSWQPLTTGNIVGVASTSHLEKSSPEKSLQLSLSTRALIGKKVGNPNRKVLEADWRRLQVSKLVPRGHINRGEGLRLAAHANKA